MDENTTKVIEGIISTLDNIVNSLKTQAELNKKIMEKLDALENYEYLDG